MKTFDGIRGPATALAYSPDNTILASGSMYGRLDYWEAATGKKINSFQHIDHSISSLSFSPNNKSIALAINDSLSDEYLAFVRNLSSGNITNKISMKHRILTLRYSPEGGVIALGLEDGTIALWDVKQNSIIKEFKNPTGGSIYTLNYDLKGERIVSGSSDKIVRIWNSGNGQILQEYKGHSRAVLSVMFSPKGAAIISGSSDGAIRIWKNLKSYPMMRLLYEFDPEEVLGALKFLWQLRLDGLNYIPDYPKATIFQNKGYYITWNEYTEKFRPLLDAPHPNETKMDQLVRWLEERKAYRKVPVGAQAQ